MKIGIDNLKFSLLLTRAVLFLCLQSLLTGTNAYAQPTNVGETIVPWSVRFAESFIKLHPDTIRYEGEAKSRKWNYEQGLMLGALHQIYKEYGIKKYFGYVKQNLDYYIEENGNIKTYEQTEFNIDNIPPGRMLLMLHKETKLEKYKLAADNLRGQLRSHPRTKDGGFWHKKIYPGQMWLDGLYMGEPFYAKYSSYTRDTAAYADIMQQFRLIYQHARDAKTGLLYHAWDSELKQKWADPATGKSPNFWGRAMGWYMMALVDVLDYLPKDYQSRNELIDQLNALSTALLTVRDSDSKLWFQLLSKPALKGNYLEASASLMFTYAFAKGANKGYLSASFLEAARESFAGALKQFVVVDDLGTIYLQEVCKVAGLGGNPYRDGSDAYYLSEQRRVNDFKGYGPLIFAAVELEKAERKTSKNIGLDYFFNNEYKDGKRFHYVWEDTAFSGFSELGKLFVRKGAKLSTVAGAPTDETLSGLQMYFVVDPDTKAETANPNFIDDSSIGSIVRWVENGGVLVLLANDSANCEFEHLNRLAEKFGIHFNGDSENRVTGKNFEMGKVDSLPDHPVFSGVKKLYMKEISTIKCFDYAEPVIRRGNKALMVNVSYGKGFVFAVGDPWLYNEYIDNRRLPVDFENYKAAGNLVSWLLTKSR